MLKKNKLLIISNGHGEDIVGSLLIKEIKKTNPTLIIDALPLVGDGKYYETSFLCKQESSIKILGSKKNLPSGGFSLRNPLSLFKDIKAGYFNHLIQTWKTIRENKKQYDLVIAIGDIIPVLAGVLVQCPIIYLGINKSAYYQSWGFNYLWLEKIILKYCVKKTFARDKLTSDQLSAFGIKSIYVGNPMMDAVIMSNAKCQMSNEGNIIIGFLPGTRADAKLNIEDFEKIAQTINNEQLTMNNKVELLIATQEEIPSILKKASFDELISKSDIIIGLSGTGNEQAAGCGIPIISFPGRGSQYTAKFAKAQKELLGEALKIFKNEPTEVSLAIKNILTQKEIYDKMSQAGKERMGKPGAIKEITKGVFLA